MRLHGTRERPTLPPAPVLVVGGVPVPRSAGGELGPVGTSVLWEDAVVRVWENRVPPGHASAEHSHGYDYWLLTQHGGEVTVFPRPGTMHGTRVFSGSAGRRGDAVFIPAGAREIAENVGASEQVFYLVELKQGGLGPAPVAAQRAYAAGPGTSAEVLYDGADVRVWDLRLHPGRAGGAPVEHDCWMVDIVGEREGAPRFTELAADRRVMSSRPLRSRRYGTLYWQPRGTAGAGTARNAGAGAYRGIVVELKAPPPAKL